MLIRCSQQVWTRCSHDWIVWYAQWHLDLLSIYCHCFDYWSCWLEVVIGDIVSCDLLLAGSCECARFVDDVVDVLMVLMRISIMTTTNRYRYSVWGFAVVVGMLLLCWWGWYQILLSCYACCSCSWSCCFWSGDWACSSSWRWASATLSWLVVIPWCHSVPHSSMFTYWRQQQQRHQQQQHQQQQHH